jgi:hypothetical protein
MPLEKNSTVTNPYQIDVPSALLQLSRQELVNSLLPGSLLNQKSDH